MTGISALAVARTRTVAEPALVARRDPPRLDRVALDGRADLVVVPADGSGPRRRRHRRRRRRPGSAPTAAAAWCWVDDDGAGLRRGRRPRSSRCPAAGGRGDGCCRRDGRAAAPGGRARRAGRVRARARRRLRRRRGRRSTARAGRERVSNADFAWDPTWSRRRPRLAWHEWDLPACRGTRRASCRRGRRHRRGADARRGWRRRRGRPAPLLARRRALAFVSDATAGGTCGRRGRRRRGARVACSPSRTSTPSRRGVRASARSRGRPTATAIACAATRTASVASSSSALDGTRPATRAVEGLAPRPRLGRARHRVRALRRAHRRRRSRCSTRDRRAATIARGGAPAELEAVDLPEPEPVTWQQRRRRDGARAAVAARRRRRRRPARRRRCSSTSTAARPARRPSTGSRGSRCFVRAGGRCCAPTTAGSTGYGREYRRRSTTRWGDVDVADTAAGIRAAGERDWCRPGPRRGDGWQRRRPHRAARRRAARRRWSAAVVSLFGVTDLFDLAATTHRFESRYLDRLVGPLPGRRPLPRALAGHARRARSRCRCSCCRAPPTRWCRPRRRSCSSTRARRRRHRRAPRVRGRGPRLVAGGRRSPTSSSGSTRSSRAGCCNDDVRHDAR